ncbi:mucin-2-like [Schistocerca serialis cubense]|uniref:mucin-2-like n=1 Tax=Schistocerca serialis cubense TaxID=2023355 RepID=UPI00214E610C|nr:mucin-2-like [Schistocerca serialis cubense]
MTNAVSHTVTENTAEVRKAAKLTAVESTSVSEEPLSVTAEVTPPALEPAPTSATPSPSTAVAEETPPATAEAAPPAEEPVSTAAAPSPTPAVAEPTPLPVISETTTPPAATKPTSPPAETEPAPPSSSSGVGEKNRSVTRLQYLPTTYSVVPVSSSQKVSLGVTDAELDTVTENAAEVPKEAILTEVESTAGSEEPRSVTAEVTPPALERAPTAVTPSPSPAVTAQTTSPEIAEETATAEATPPAVELVPIAAAPSPTPAVAEPTPLPVIAETIPPPTAETVQAPPPSPSRVAEKNRPVTVSKVSSLSHDEVIPNDLGKHVPIKLVDSKAQLVSMDIFKTKTKVWMKKNIFYSVEEFQNSCKDDLIY